jgi:lysophospholipase L1-like esterase
VSPRDALPWTPTDFNSLKPGIPTLIIAGDSTVDRGPDAWHRGWGAPLVDYFDTSKINVVNRGRGGRSYRTFVHEGLWDQIVAALKPGDYVMIQFGHNDGGDIHAANGRPDLPGTGEETQTITRADGTTEVVHTVGWYCRKFINDVKSKKAYPIVMSATPYGRWVNGVFQHRPGDMAQWNEQVAREEKVPYLDHTAIISDRYDQLGEAVVKTYFNADTIHTSTPGAITNDECFVAGLKQLKITELVDALNDKGKAIAAYVPAPATQPAGR